ncbi:hypothetical protein S40293_07056 [Stachybotrys chartarum IBT 40293]|nr:hypothetical protein S40293_07056 [Stachybotrys chartarum IBT 40293]
MEPKTDQGFFQCGSCKRQYRRLDHLARHVRSHTQSRPHKCHVCGKGFTRTDLLKRHVGAHTVEGADDGQTATSAPLQETLSRVSKACRTCASNHLRCSEEKPCLRCKTKGLECVWTPPLLLDHTYPVAPTEGSVDEVGVEQRRVVEMTPPHETGAPPRGMDMQEVEETHPVNETMYNMFQSHGPIAFEDVDAHFPVGELSTPSWLLSPSDAFNTTAHLTVEFSDLDLHFLDSYNISVPFERVPSSMPRTRDEQISGAQSQREQPDSVLNEAFEDSPWQFRPNAQDHAAAEEHNLSLPQIPDEQISTESRVPRDGRMVCNLLGVGARDKILTMVTRSCHFDNISKIVQAFPSVELLDALVQYYLTSPVAWPHSFLHAATFDPNEKRPELVAAMAAAGSLLTTDPALAKLGFALQESVRIAIPKHWEQDNSLVRDLELAQAFLIILEIGLWSGHGRKVEIAESFLQPLLTMLRRDGKFQRSTYARSFATENLEGDALRKKWHEWVEMESFERLCYRVLLHDTNSSMALLTNPLLSYAEVMLPLPGCAQAWSARTAKDWRAIYQTSSNHPAVGIADLLDDPELLNSYHTSVDTAIARYAILSVIWSLTWEHLQLTSLQRQAPRRWNSVIMDLRRDELVKLLDNIRVSLFVSDSPEFMMRLELTFLHLYMPFEDIQNLAGLQGPAHSRAIYPVVSEWVKTQAARQAIYHAGQVFRYAKAIPSGAIRGPAAFMLYYATLAFWVWGLFTDQRSGESSASARTAFYGPTATGETVFVDAQEDILVQRFIQLGQGVPYIQISAQSSTATPLSSTDQVMQAVQGLLDSNFTSTGKPHLIVKLTDLISGLTNSYKRVKGMR